MTTTGSTAQSADTNWSADLISARTNAQQIVKASYESSVITFEEYAERVIHYAESDTERNRRTLIDRRLRVLRDSWGPLLKQAFGNWVTPEIAELVLGAGRDHVDISRNPAKHIWQELAVLYKLPPKRFTDNVKDGEKYNALVADTDFNMWWQLVELLLVACNEVVIWPDVITRGGKKLIKHRAAVGNVLSAIPIDADPTEIECWLVIDEYQDLEGAEHTRYRLWTDRWHGEFQKGEKGDLERSDRIDPKLYGADGEGDFTVTNPYGEIPQVRIRLTPWPDLVWDITTGEDLIDLTLHNGIDRAFYRYLQKVGGFKQGVATGDFDKQEKQLLDPAYMIKLQGENARFSVVDWQLDLKARLECMEREELAAAASKGINPERYKRTASYQTSFGARLAERGLAEYRIRNAPILERAEREYYRKLCIVAKAHGIDNIPNPDTKLEVMHHSISFPDDPKSQIEVDKLEIAMGLESPKTVLAKRHPEWTENEVEQQLKANMDEIAKFNEMKARANVPEDPTNQSASAEINGAMGPIVRDNKQAPPGFSPRDNKGS
jgi:hypothetical protein